MQLAFDNATFVFFNFLYLFVMKLLSLNVGLPQPFSYKGKEGHTSIFKSPVNGKRQVSRLNIEGDAQGDLTVHGGALKAVYAYDIAYYSHWKQIIQRENWSYGLFGENLTTEGLTDDKVFIGNIYKIGSVHLKAIQPRFPCYKLNIRFGVDDMLQQFMQQRKHGTYFSVEQEGSLQAGDDFELIHQSPYKITITELVECYYNKGADKHMLQQILEIDFLPERLRKSFESYTTA
jgi:MOSC domain-containing protein YiiM